MPGPAPRSHAAVGSTAPRPDGPDKVSGRTRYVADLRFDGAWYGGVVRSPVARGVLLGIDVAPDFDVERVVVVGPRDIQGSNVVAMIADDQPLLAERELRHVGEPLLLIAAKDPATLSTALRAFRPRIEAGTPILDPRASTQVFKTVAIDKGDAPAALARAARTFEGEYRTGTQEQLYIETQGVIALPPDANGVVTVHGSLQCPYYVQKALCKALALPPEKCRVVQAATGGGFGGKEDYPSVLGCHAALLALRCGKPVRMILDRHEDLLVTPKRHPSIVRIRSAFRADGTLDALDVDVLFDGGAYTTLSPVVLSRGCIHAAGPYRCDHVRIRGRAVATNHVPYGAFRGFGAPQTCFAIERHFDHVAHELGIHPFELRRRNLLRLGDSTATSQVLRESVGMPEVLERITAATAIDRHPWRAERPATSRIRNGRGLATFFHGAGFTGSGEAMLKAKVVVEPSTGGKVLVRCAATEFGQGTIAMLRAIAAQALGRPEDDVSIATPDTQEVPDSGPTVASRTCMIVGGVLVRACREFLAGGSTSRVEATHELPPDHHWDDAQYRGDAYPAYGWAADVADVEVDLDTFEVRVTRFCSAVDVGRAIRPQLVEGQIEGGSLQAIGFAHQELVTSQDGRIREDRLSTCIIPTALDAPDFDVALVEAPFSRGPFGAKGVGELPMDGGAPAVLSAIEDALGIHVTELPATPERLLAAWRAKYGDDEDRPR